MTFLLEEGNNKIRGVPMCAEEAGRGRGGTRYACSFYQNLISQLLTELV